MGRFRDRFFATIGHQRPDRMPLDLWVQPEVMRRLQKYLDMEDLISIGFDIINPIQPECMDPYEVKRRWGDRITMWGTISVRTTLPSGTPGTVRTLVRERIRRCGQDGGLVIGPANVIMYDTPVENIVAMYEAAMEFMW